MILLNNKKDYIIDLSDQYDYKISLYVTAFFVTQALNAGIKGVMPNMGTAMWTLMSLGFGGLQFLLLLISVRYVLRREGKLLGGTCVCFGILYTISFAMASLRGEPTDVITNIALKNTFLFWIPIGIWAASIVNYRVLYEVLLRFSYLISIPWIMYSYTNATIEDGDTYNMLLGYSLALPCALHSIEYLKNKKIVYLLSAVIEFLFIVFMSSRGVLVSLGIFVLLYYLYASNNGSKGKNAIVIIVLLVLILSNMSTLINGLNEFFLDQFGIGSRTLTMMIEGDVNSQSGREIFREAGMWMVDEKLLTGWGIGGDYYTMANLLHGDYTTGITCHNGIIQLMTYFGAPIGALVSLLFATSFLRCSKSSDFHLKLIIILFYSLAVFPSLIYGDGLLEKPGAAMYLFICIVKLFRK